MEINSYSFGTIIIDSRKYERDIIVFPEKVCPDWQRIKGHSLILKDLKEVIDYKPQVLIIGTGAYAGMTIPKTTKAQLKDLRIKLIAADTEKACRLFNENIKLNIRAAGAFHLTC